MKPGGRVASLGTLKDILKRLWRRASLFIGAPLLGEPRGGLVYRGLLELDVGALGMGYRSLKRLREGASGRATLPGNLKDEVFERYANALWVDLPLIEALLGNL